MFEKLFSTPILVFGCGNTLFGDDGFGPEVIERLIADHHLPPSVYAVDVGTSLGDILFDFLLSPARPSHIFIVDAVCQPGRRAGALFEIALDDVPAAKSSDFSLHQFPSVNLLRELRDQAGIAVRILAVQVKELPQAVAPGLSQEVQAAVPEACRWLMEAISPLSGCDAPAAASAL